MVYSVLKKRVVEQVAPGLKKDKGKEQLIMTIILLVLAGFGGAFAGFYADTNFIHPPIQAIGVCAAPNFIQNGGCYTLQTEQVQQNGQTITKTVQVPAGYIIPSSVTHP